MGLLAVSIAVAILLICSGLISGSEVAFFSLSPKEKLDLEGNANEKKQNLVLDLLDKPNELLATILIANNLVNVAIIVLSSMLMEGLIDFGNMSTALQFVIQVVVVTFVLLLLGEVAPKTYATKYALRVANLMAFPLFVMRKIFYPLSRPLILGTNIIDKRVKKRTETVSVDQLEHALEIATDEETSDEEKKILEGIVKFGNTDVKQIMKPRTDVLSFEESTNYEKLLEGIVDSGYSRIPVYRESFDQIVGVLYIKDLLPHLDAKKNFEWQKLVRAPFFVPENKKIDDLLKEFQEKKIHLALVVDEYGGTSGIVTLEDIIEEIVGDITDEFDDDDLVYSKLDDRTFIFEGKTPLNDMYRVLEIDGMEFEEAKGESDTLAGFVIEQSGKILKKNEKVFFEGYHFTVDAADKRRIKRLKVVCPETKEEEEESEEKNHKKGKVSSIILLFILSTLLTACSEDYIPKPKGYFRITLPEKNYESVAAECPFDAEIPTYSTMTMSRESKADECWLNIVFPQNKATVHLTYKEINNDLSELTEEARRLVFEHQVKANAIDQKFLHIDSTDVQGLVYRIGGNVASSLQFYVTDSAKHFLRGSLYFNHVPNEDSIAPVLDFITEDVEYFIRTLRWRDA